VWFQMRVWSWFVFLKVLSSVFPIPIRYSIRSDSQSLAHFLYFFSNCRACALVRRRQPRSSYRPVSGNLKTGHALHCIHLPLATPQSKLHRGLCWPCVSFIPTLRFRSVSMAFKARLSGFLGLCESWLV